MPATDHQSVADICASHDSYLGCQHGDMRLPVRDRRHDRRHRSHMPPRYHGSTCGSCVNDSRPSPGDLMSDGGRQLHEQEPICGRCRPSVWTGHRKGLEARANVKAQHRPMGRQSRVVIVVVGLFGLAIINRGADRSRRRRRERRALAREIGASVSWRRKIVTTSPRSALRMLTRPWTCRRGSADAGRRGEHARARLLS